MRHDNQYLYEEAPVSKAVLSLAIPTVISQLITVVYNMADTFFVGQLNDPAQVAAATIAMPAFMFLNAFANLFGLGGSSLISRCLGKGDKEKARHTAAFCIWMGMIVAFLYGVIVVALKPVLFPLLGATAQDWDYCSQYVFWTIGVGAVPTVMNAEIAHLVRSEGYAKPAAFGVALGGVLNMVLDPIFIFGFGMAIRGAAIATMLSNLVAMLYFFLFLYHIRSHTVITPNPKEISFGESIPREVIMVGLPGFVMTMMSTVSNAALNHIVAGYSEKAIAGMGIAKKIDLLAYAIAQGMTQGTLSLIGYNYTAGNTKRMKESVKTATLYSFIVAIAGMLVLQLCAVPICRCFIEDAETVEHAQSFLKIISLACPTTAINFMVITIFQAVGERWKPLVLSLLRKGSIDVVLMILFNHQFGIGGIAWATPVADWIAFVVSLLLIIPFLKKMNSAKETKMAY